MALSRRRLFDCNGWVLHLPQRSTFYARGASISNQESANQQTTCVDSAAGVVRAEKAVGGGQRNSVSPAKKKTPLSSAHDTVMNLAIKLGMICVAAGKWQFFRLAWRRKRCSEEPTHEQETTEPLCRDKKRQGAMKHDSMGSSEPHDFLCSVALQHVEVRW